MTAGGEKRRWTSRIGTIIRRTSKSQRVSHTISFDKDAEFVSRNCDDGDSGKTLPQIALDIQPMLSTLCTIAESPLREAEATQSATGPCCIGGPVYEVNTPSSNFTPPRAVIDSPEPVSTPIIRIGEVFIIPDPIYEEPQATGPPQLDFTEGPSLTTKDHQVEVPRSLAESTDETSMASFYEMTQCNSIHHVPSNSSPSITPRGQLSLDLGHIDTCLLLTQHDTLETPVTTHSSDDSVISWLPNPTSSDKLEKLHTMGWLEYHFPNGKSYYFHPERKVSTEVDLTNDTFLNLVETFWEEEGMNVGSWSIPRRNSKLGVTSLNGSIEDEIWLKDIKLSNEGSETMFEMWWVDHVARTMVLVNQEINNGGAATIQEDQIDMEYRYWAFIQSHPAHTVLPPNAKSAAINTLAWAWTDHLLSSDQYDSIPFTEEECRDMMTLLQSLVVEKRHHQMIQTCIVANIFLQVAQWHKSRRSDTNTSSTDIRSPILESSNQLLDSRELEKSRISRRIFIDLVIFISILLFLFLYALSQGSLRVMFTQVQVFVDEIIESLGQASASIPTLNWTRMLQCMGWSRLRDVGI